MPGSACGGRIIQYVYLASWDAMNASIAAMFITARTCAARSSLKWNLAISRVASSLAYAAATLLKPPGLAQNFAIESCRCVRLSENERTSARSVRKAGEPNAGGGPGRNWLADFRKKVCISLRRGNTGIFPGALVQQPGHTGMLTPSAELVNPSVAARAMTAAPAARPIVAPAAKSECRWPGRCDADSWSASRASKVAVWSG